MTESQEIEIEKPGDDLQSRQESLGEVFLAARTAKKLSQQDVSNNLRFSIKQIDALENNAFDLLPDAVITRGFIRNYARLLEIDAEPLLASYRASVADDSHKGITVRSSMHPVQLTKDSQPWLKYVLGSILVLLFLLAWFFYMDYKPKLTNAAVEKAPEVVVENKTSVAMPLPEVALPAAERQTDGSEIAAGGVNGANPQMSDTQATDTLAGYAKSLGASAAQTDLKLPAESKKIDVIKEAEPKEIKPKEVKPGDVKPGEVKPAAPQALAAQPSQVAAANSADRTVNMTFSDRTWVSVTDKSGKVIYEKLSRNGDTETINGKPPFNMVIGNASATKLSFSGQNIDLTAHTKNNVARITLE